MTVNLTENDFFFVLVSCRVRPGGGGSDADSLDLDRMKQVKKIQKTQTHEPKFETEMRGVFLFV